MTPGEIHLADELPELVWVNAWSSLNNEGHEVGISYCKIVYVEDETMDEHVKVEPVDEPVNNAEPITFHRFQNEELQGAQTNAQPREPCLEPAADAEVTAVAEDAANALVLGCQRRADSQD